MPLGASRVPFNIHLQIQQNLEITITRTILNRSDLKTESTIGNSIAINLKNGFELETQKLRLPKIKLQKIHWTPKILVWLIPEFYFAWRQKNCTHTQNANNFSSNSNNSQRITNSLNTNSAIFWMVFWLLRRWVTHFRVFGDIVLFYQLLNNVQ